MTGNKYSPNKNFRNGLNTNTKFNKCIEDQSTGTF